MILFIILVIVVASICYYSVKTFRNLDDLRNNRESILKTLDKNLNARYDIMNAMLEYSEGFIGEENRFLVKLLQAKLVPVNERFGVEKEFVDELKILINTIEDLPQLSNDRDFVTLRVRLAKAEKAIYDTRTSLNDNAKEINAIVQAFPSSIVATVTGYKYEPAVDIDFVTR